METRFLYGSIFLLVILFFSLTMPCKYTEGFSGSYADCRSKGFTSEFCVQTPIASYGVGTFLCDDGSMGLQMPGFAGECVCQAGLANPLYR